MSCHLCFERVFHPASRLNQQSLHTLPMVAGLPQRQSPFSCLEVTILAKDLCCLSAHLEHLVNSGRSIPLPQSWQRLCSLRYWAIFLNRSLCAGRQVSQNKILSTAGLPQKIHKLFCFLSSCSFEYPIILLQCCHYKNIIAQFKKGGKPYWASPSVSPL